MFKVGSKVEARMPGSRSYFNAEVLDTKGSTFVIKFNDGSVHSVSEMYIRPVSKVTMRTRRQSRSPARNKVSEEVITSTVEKKVKTKQSELEVIESPKVSIPEVRRKGAKSPARVPRTTQRANEIKTRSKSRSRAYKKESAPIETEPKQPEKITKQKSPLARRSTRPLANSKSWTEKSKNRASVVLTDILNSSRSNSRQSSTSQTNSELEALSRTNLDRDSPEFTETDFLHSDIEDTITGEEKLFTRFTKRSSRTKSRTPEVKPLYLPNAPKPELILVRDMLNSEVSDLDEEIPSDKPTINIIGVIQFVIGACLIFSVPLICLYLHDACNYYDCLFRYPNVEHMKHFNLYFSQRAFIIYMAYYLVMTFLSIIRLLGTSMDGFPNKDGVPRYYFNGVFSAITLTSLLASAHYYKFPILSYVLEQDLRLLVLSMIFAFAVSVILFLKHYFTTMKHTQGYTRNKIMDFWYGYELSPRILSILDIKLIHYRMAMITTIIFMAAYAKDDVQNLFTNILYNQMRDYNSTLILIAALNIFFHLDLLTYEKQLITTLEFQNENTGFMILLKNSLYPFLVAFSTKYISYQNIRVSTLAHFVIAIVFLLGYALFRYSNNMKFAIRLNPADPRFEYKDFYLAFTGKRLLLRKTWGFVRHPNYLGHIIMLLTFSCPLFWAKSLNVMPFIPLIICVLFLLHRAARDNRVCGNKHGSSWVRYCGIVKYKVIPYIY